MTRRYCRLYGHKWGGLVPDRTVEPKRELDGDMIVTIRPAFRTCRRCGVVEGGLDVSRKKAPKP